MIHLLLVDDEPIIVDSLQRLLESLNDLPLKVWKAYSASEAIETMETMGEHAIDILMTDVMMPGMNGLELSAFVKNRFPKRKTLFLSGYSNYSYLQTALHQEAFDYLLKPADDETVIESIHKLCKIVEEERKLEERKKQIGAQLVKALNILNDELLEELLEKPLTPQQLTERDQQLRRASLNAEENLILVLGRVDQWSRVSADAEKKQKYREVGEFAEGRLGTHGHVVYYSGTRYMVWLIQSISGKDEEEACDLLRLHWSLGKELEKIQTSIKESMELSCSFVVSGPSVEWLQLSGTYRKMSELLDRAIGVQHEIMWVEQSTDVISRYKDTMLMPQEIRKQLLGLSGLLETGEFITFMNDLAGFFKAIQQSVFLTYERQSEIFVNLSGIFLSYMNARQITQEVGLNIDLTYLSNFNKHTDWQSFGAYCARLAENLFLVAGDEGREQKKEIAEKVDAYINRSLNRNLTLQQLAEHVHLSHFYLSRLYHAQRGYPISQKIKELKIIRARELLLQDGVKIKDVAAELGFDNVPYFTTFFRKNFGMSPKEYRYKHQG